MQKISKLLLAGLMAISTFGSNPLVYAEMPSPEVAVVEKTTTEPTATPEVTVEPTTQPTEGTVQDSTMNQNSESSNKVEPTVTPEATVKPTTVPEDVKPTTTPEIVVEPTEPTTTPEVVAPTDELINTIEVVSLEDIALRAELGESIIAFVGDVSNANYAAIVDSYSRLKDKQTEEVKAKFIAVDKNTINDELITSLSTLAYRDSDKSLIVDSLKAYKDGKNDKPVVIYTYNSTVTNVIDYSTLTSMYTPAQIAEIDFTVNYRGDAETFTTEANSGATLFKAIDTGYQEPAYGAGETWKYAAKGRLQQFTARVAGWYDIELWGASGDSDIGGRTEGHNKDSIIWTTGIGGDSATVKGRVYLNKGQTIYLALGFQNAMNTTPAYNGGGAGAPQRYGYRAGGGGAGSIYLSEHGNGEIKFYESYKDQILMVAGGGGGAEDFYGVGLSWGAPYYCLYNRCETSLGGNGGLKGTNGRGSGPNGVGGGYKFGIGENYNSYDNSSSGGGGGGYYGGTSGNGNQMTLRGGTGGGGSSYTSSAVQNVEVIEGKNMGFNFQPDNPHVEHGRDAGAIIKFAEVGKYPLTIHYVDKNTNKEIAPTYNKEYSYGEQFSVTSPVVDGYSVVNVDEKVIEGTMPDKPVEITVLYDYAAVRVYYQDYDTKETLSPTWETRQLIGTPWHIDSPNVKGYVFYDNNQAYREGVKTAVEEEYYVYYVPQFKPTKHITAVNGVAISQAVSDKGVTLKKGDIVTYTIRYENKRGVSVSETFTDNLPDTVEYIGNAKGHAIPTVNGRTLTWKVNMPARTKGEVSFDVKVVNSSNKPSIDNWDRKDPFVDYTVTKSATPQSGSKVAYGDVITYNLKVKNNGTHPVNNILVIDKIPANTEFYWTSYDYKGEFVRSGNYVRYVIDTLAPNSVANLQFKVKVTAKVTDSSSVKILNHAMFDNFSEYPKSSDDNHVINKGQHTNETTHEVVGPKIEITKTANPADGTPVSAGTSITYNVKVTNTGNVKTNFVRITDDIPEGTSYTNNSLSINNPNPETHLKYGVSFGEKFDIHYDGANNNYYIDNIADILTTSGNNPRVLQVMWSNGLNVNNVSTPGGWTKYNPGGNTLYYSLGNNNSQNTIKNFLKGLRFSGTGGEDKFIRIDCYDVNAIGRFDEKGVIHFYEFVSGEKTWIQSKSEAAGRWMNGLQGYLVTITSLEEQSFLAQSVATISGWLGGSRYTDYGSKSGNWEWVTGPEAGTAFYTKTRVQDGGHALPGQFAYFDGAQPDNYPNNPQSSYREVGGEGVLQAFAYGDKWNDLYGDTNPVVHGYYVEYSDGYNGHYLPRSAYQTNLPKADNGGSCKYITTNGKPYVECITSDIEPNKSATMSFQVKVNNPVPAHLQQIRNTAMFENMWNNPGYAGDVKTKPTNPSNTTIHPLGNKLPNITAIKGSDPVSKSIVSPLDYIVYNIDVTNNGNGVAKFTTVREYLPVNVHYANKITGGHDRAFVQNGDRPYVEWVLNDMQPGETRRVTYTVQVDETADTAKKIICHALYELHNADPGAAGTLAKDPAKSTNETIHSLISHENPGTPNPSVKVTKFANPASGAQVARQSDIEYTIQVSEISGKANVGPMVVRDYIPAGTTFKELKPHVGGNKNSEFIISQAFVDGDKPYVEWVINRLGKTDSVELKFVVTVNKEATETAIVNHALYDAYDNKIGSTLTAGKVTTPPTIATNQTNHPLINPTIKVVKTSNPESGRLVPIGGVIKYTLTVTNTSSVLANYSNIEDKIPEEVVFMKNSIDVPTAGDIGKLSADGKSVQFAVYDLQPNESRSMSFEVEVKENIRKGDEIHNIATYGTTITDGGKPGTDTFIPPTTQSNETIHTVEWNVDIIPTGGDGWGKLFPIIGVGSIALLIFLIFIKKKKDKDE